MSDHQHSSPIKNWKQLVVVVVAGFAIPIVLIVLLSQLVSSRPKGPGEDDHGVLNRIKPVGEIKLAVAAGPKGALTGDQVYEQVCKSCHEGGLAGAHKIGDRGAWAKVIAQGPKLTYEHAIAGIRAMPAKGGNPNLEDIEVQRAVAFLVNKAGAGWLEPAGPAAVARPAAPLEGRTGEQVVAAACGKCHQTGQGGAPKIGDRAAWTSRVKRGLDPVVKSAIKGHAGMPARGGLADLTDAEVKRAVEFMMNSGAGTAAVAAAPAARRGCRARSSRRRQEGLRHCLHGLPRLGCRRRAEVGRQGRVGAAAQDRGRRPVRERAQGQGRDAGQGRQRCAVGCRGQGERRLHDRGGEVTAGRAVVPVRAWERIGCTGGRRRCSLAHSSPTYLICLVARSRAPRSAARGALLGIGSRKGTPTTRTARHTRGGVASPQAGPLLRSAPSACIPSRGRRLRHRRSAQDRQRGDA